MLTGLGAGHDRVRDRVADLVNQRAQADEEARRAGWLTAAELADTAEQWQLEAASEPPDTLQVVRAENQRLRRELDRLRGVLRDHGIDPDAGTARLSG